MKTIKVMRDGRPATAEELQCAVEGKPLPIATPRTNAAKFTILSDLQSGTREVVAAEEMEKLERELAVVKSVSTHNSEQAALFASRLREQVQSLQSERDKLQRENEELKSHEQELRNYWTEERNDHNKVREERDKLREALERIAHKDNGSNWGYIAREALNHSKSTTQ